MQCWKSLFGPSEVSSHEFRHVESAAEIYCCCCACLPFTYVPVIRKCWGACSVNCTGLTCSDCSSASSMQLHANARPSGNLCPKQDLRERAWTRVGMHNGTRTFFEVGQEVVAGQSVPVVLPVPDLVVVLNYDIGFIALLRTASHLNLSSDR